VTKIKHVRIRWQESAKHKKYEPCDNQPPRFSSETFIQKLNLRQEAQELGAPLGS
jgi:hypothetical protein